MNSTPHDEEPKKSSIIDGPLSRTRWPCIILYGSYANYGSSSRRLRVSPCHPESNEGSVPSSPRPWLSQMLRAAQHDNSVEDVFFLVFLVILRHTITSSGYCQLNENSTVSTQFPWRESIDLSGITPCAPHVQSAISGLSVDNTLAKL